MVDVPRTILFMPQMAFVLEDAKERAHRGRAGRLRQLLVNLGRRRVSVAVDDVHDLALAPAQLRVLIRDSVRLHGHSEASKRRAPDLIVAPRRHDKELSLLENILSCRPVVNGWLTPARLAAPSPTPHEG